MYWTSHLCRLCAQISQISFSIYDKSTISQDIPIKIKRCLGLNVMKDDLKPKEICNQCLLKLDDFFDFIQLCDGSNMKFEQLLLQYDTEQQKWNQNNYVQKNSVIVPNECESVTNTDIIMLVQSNNQIIDNSYNTDNFIGKKSGSSVLRHSGQIHKMDNIYSMNYENLDGKYAKNSCILPTFQNNTEKQMENHYEVIPLDINYGPQNNCDKVYNDDFNQFQGVLIDEQFSKKQKTIETKKMVSVDDVKKSVGFNDKLDNVIRPQATKGSNADKAKHFTCSDCGKTFKRKNSLKAHVSVHTKVRPFICELCDKSFAVKSDLSMHKNLHTDLYKCTFCSKSFIAQSKLDRHERIHKNERPFICSVEGCDKRFSDKRNLMGHVVTHSDARDFSCESCGKKYKTKSQLSDHGKAHEKDKNYKCPVCGKSYKWKTNLGMHMKKHNGYKCLTCKMNCGKLSVLIKHRKDCKKTEREINI